MKLIGASVLSCVIALMVLSCSKDSAKPSAAESNAVLLAGAKGQSKAWTLSQYTEAKNGAAAVDYTSQLDAAFSDNIYTFYNNDTQDYQGDEGATKYNSSDPSTMEKGTWAFTDNGKTLLVEGTAYSANYLFAGISRPFSIANLTSVSFTASFTAQDTLNNTYLVTLGFSKK